MALRADMDVALPGSAGSAHTHTHSNEMCACRCMFPAEFLSGRGWKGLEQRLGEGGVATAMEGKRGVASSYSHEQL